jgi:sterol desaturase/sphingolipid hydroxylase (fatty acid hydroxylase superfamily)
MEPRVVLVALLLALLLLEVVWAARHRPRAYQWREVLCNLTIAAVNGALKPLALAWQLLVMELAASFQWLPTLPVTPLVFALTFVATDFVYYWYHRWSHAWPVLWAFHHVHHSSQCMNLSTAPRLGWLGKLVAPVFFVPLTLVGLPADLVVASLALGLLFQFPLHTQAIGALGAFEGRLLNTPSAHRVHHGSNERYLDRNFGGVLIVWDVLFGTYTPETEPVDYGVAEGFVSHNPLVVQFLPLWRLLCSRGSRQIHGRGRGEGSQRSLSGGAPPAGMRGR